MIPCSKKRIPIITHINPHSQLLELYEASVAWGAAPPNDWAALTERRAALFAGAEAALLAAKADHLPAVAAACGVENE